MFDTDDDESPVLHSNLNALLHARGLWLVFFIIALLLVVGLYCSKHGSGKSNVRKPIPVVATVSISRDVPVYLPALGGVTPLDSVTVKTQINGQLQQVFFKEGQMVKKGELLAQIDPRPYQAQLIQYEGQLKRDKALLSNALIDLKRYKTLWKKGSIAQQALANQISLVIQYEGAVQIDTGLLQTTQLNLTYCQITSPVDGRIGLRLVDPGNYVQTTDTTGLFVINSLNPITVVFTLPEDNIPQVLPQIDASQRLLVKVYDRQQNKLLARGALLTLDNQIDPSTGTVKLKALFKNENGTLFPNQFVNVQLRINTLHQATVLPTEAIQHSSKGDFVYLINSDQTVTAQSIVTGIAIGEHTVITHGLKPGQSVVIDGADRLTDGTRILSQPPSSLTQHANPAEPVLAAL